MQNGFWRNIYSPETIRFRETNPKLWFESLLLCWQRYIHMYICTHYKHLLILAWFLEKLSILVRTKVCPKPFVLEKPILSFDSSLFFYAGKAIYVHMYSLQTFINPCLVFGKTFNFGSNKGSPETICLRETNPKLWFDSFLLCWQSYICIYVLITNIY